MRRPFVTCAVLVASLGFASAGRGAPADDLPDPPPPEAAPPAPKPKPEPPPPAAAPTPVEDKLPPLPGPAAPHAGPTVDMPPDLLSPDLAAPAVRGGAAEPTEIGSGHRSSIGAYGEAQLFAGEEGKEMEAKLRRFVVFVGHRFTDWLRVYTETEVEDGHEIELEQASVEVVPDARIGVRAGLLLLPLGIINQLHEPPTFLTVDRPLTDQLIIPSTWRELGVGVFGQLGEGVSYQGSVMSGLDPFGFNANAPLVGARGNGREVDVHDVAFAGRLDYAGVVGLNVGAGGYVGWATGGVAELAGVRVGVAEADARYRHQGWDLRAEYAHLFIVNSYRLNDYFGLTGAQAIAARGRGFYVQAGYDLLRLFGVDTSQELTLFAGYENVNPRSRMSSYNLTPPSISGPNQASPNAPSEARQFVRAGLTYRPHVQVALKVDVQIALSEEEAAPPATPPAPGAPGMLRPISPEVAELAKGESRLGLAAAFMF